MVRTRETCRFILLTEDELERKFIEQMLNNKKENKRLPMPGKAKKGFPCTSTGNGRGPAGLLLHDGLCRR